jgi:hypothetical protein
MHRVGRAAVALAVLCAAGPAFGQGSAWLPVATKPYQAVAVRVPAGPGDPSFAAFRTDLAAVARTRLFATLARYVVPRGFFWERDFAKGFDPKKSSAENLAAAISLERGSGSGWQTLAAFAAEPGATEIPASPGVLCAPAQPVFDSEDFERLTGATRSNASEWGYPRAPNISVRKRPRPESAVVETLGAHFVRIVRFETAPANPAPFRTAWARVATPSGKIGFVAPDTLMPLGAPRLCYIKDITGRWRITGFIGGKL